ncbi:MAG: hypothetical protein ACFCBW_11955 [Candidatus Competibacterales bacterium]
MRTAPWGAVCALKGEARTLAAGPWWVVTAGVGGKRARRAGEHLLARGAVGLVSWGCAAALSPALSPGDLVLPRGVVAADGAWLPCDPSALALLSALAPAAHPGVLAEAREVLVEPAAKVGLARATGALAADMESAALARLALERGVAFAALRAISDGLDRPLPGPLVAAAVEAPSGGTLLALLGRRPALIPAAISLGLGYGRALKALAKAARGLDGEADGEPEPDASHDGGSKAR